MVRLINGGFMVMNPEIFDYLEGTTIEQGTNETDEGQGMKSFYHGGFWQCMDTQRNEKTGRTVAVRKAPWKIWKD